MTVILLYRRRRRRRRLHLLRQRRRQEIKNRKRLNRKKQKQIKQTLRKKDIISIQPTPSPVHLCTSMQKKTPAPDRKEITDTEETKTKTTDLVPESVKKSIAKKKRGLVNWVITPKNMIYKNFHFFNLQYC